MKLQAEPVVRHTDPRGDLIKAWPAPVAGEVYAVELRPCHPRGHHIHTHGGEWFVALQGRAVLVTERPDGSERQVHALADRRLYVPPGLAHTLFCEAPALVLAVADVHYDHEHTLPHAIVAPTEAELAALW